MITFYISFIIFFMELILNFMGVGIFDGLPSCAKALLCQIGLVEAVNMHMYIIIIGFLGKRFISFIGGV